MRRFAVPQGCAAPLVQRRTVDGATFIKNQLAHIANASGKVSNTDLLTAKQIMEQIWRYIKGGGVQ